jgi:hypothetical protein
MHEEDEIIEGGEDDIQNDDCEKIEISDRYH